MAVMNPEGSEQMWAVEERQSGEESGPHEGKTVTAPLGVGASGGAL